MSKTDYIVLVTGFGANLNAPYGNATSNPASLIARSLPHSLPSSHPLNSAKANINIIDPISNNLAELGGDYSTKRRHIKELHDHYNGNVDLWIHLGRGPWSFVTCERRAFRQDFTCSWLSEDARKGYYLYRDNEKKTAHDLGPCPWKEADVPIGLDSELDVNAVVEEANAYLKTGQTTGGHFAGLGSTLEIRSHIEAGNAGCGFAFYESMANCYVAGRRRDVLFCHVPRHTDEAEIEKGRDAILAIIAASIASIVARQEQEPADWKQSFGLVP